MQLLFVPVTGNTEDQVEKERKYAACKAHVARNAHRKRQQQVKDAQHWLSPVLVHGIHSDMDLLSFQIIPGKPSLDELVSHVRFYHRASWSSINMPDLQLGPPSGRTLSRRGISCEVTVPDRLWGFFFASAGTFASVLASIISIIRHATTRDISELERLSLQLKARSLLQLRQTIRNLPSTFVPSLALIYHVKALFREASLDGDLDGAKAHSKMLVWLTGKLPFDGDFAVDLCRLALWSDAIPALLQLRRPVMEYRHWLPRLVDSISTPAESGFTFPSHCDETLPSCISSQPLRAAFVHAHQALGIQKACRENRLRYTEDVFQWMVARAECHICSLLNLYFDLQDSSAAIELKQAERHCEAALALSLLHVYQKCFSNIRGPRPYDMDMHESAGIIYPAVVSHLQSVPDDQFDRVLCRDTRLWLLSIGSRCEEYYHRRARTEVKELGLRLACGPSPPGFFGQKLAKHLASNSESSSDGEICSNPILREIRPPPRVDGW